MGSQTTVDRDHVSFACFAVDIINDAISEIDIAPPHTRAVTESCPGVSSDVRHRPPLLRCGVQFFWFDYFPRD